MHGWMYWYVWMYVWMQDTPEPQRKSLLLVFGFSLKAMARVMFWWLLNVHCSASSLVLFSGWDLTGHNCCSLTCQGGCNEQMRAANAAQIKAYIKVVQTKWQQGCVSNCFFFSEALKLCSCLNWPFKEASISPLKDHTWCPIAKCRIAFQVNWLCAVGLWGKQYAVNPQTCCPRVKWPMHMSQRKFQDSNKGKRNLRLSSNPVCPVRKIPIQSSLCFDVDVVPKAAGNGGFKTWVVFLWYPKLSNIQKLSLLMTWFICLTLWLFNIAMV